MTKKWRDIWTIAILAGIIAGVITLNAYVLIVVCVVLVLSPTTIDPAIRLKEWQRGKRDGQT